MRPSKVVGLVLIDSYGEYHKIISPAYNWSESQIEQLIGAELALLDCARVFSVFGWQRLLISTSNYHPNKFKGIYNRFYWNSKSWQAQWADFTDTDDIIGNFSIGSKPVLFIAAGETVNQTTCAEVGEPDGSIACQQAIYASKLYKQAAIAQTRRLSTNSTFVIW